MAKITATLRDRVNGTPVASEDVIFKTPGGATLSTVATGADGSATYESNGNPAGLIGWEASVSGETRQAGAKSQRQIGGIFEAELVPSFASIVANGYGADQGDEVAVVPGTGRQVVVGTGVYWVNGMPFHFYDDTALASAANTTLAVRIDAVVIRVDFDLTSTTYGMGVLTYVPGTVNDTAPTLNADPAGDWDEVLALVTSANGFSSYTSGNINDQRSQAGPFAVAQSSVTGLTAALALLAPKASPTFTGPTTMEALAASSVTASSLSTTGGVTSGGGLNVTAGAVAFPDGSIPQADINGLVAALAAKAALAGAAFTGPATFANGMEHDGGPWGFNGSSVSGKVSDPDDILTGTIDATYGATEAAILESIRTSLNQLIVGLRSCGILSA